MSQRREGLVSVVLVNYKGTDDTLTSIRGLTKLNWPSDRLEIIVVDNDSGEEHERRLAESTLPFTLIRSGGNLGFTGGCNLGVENSHGSIVAFLNNDARAHPDWISAAMETFESSPDVGAVASKVLDWDGRHVDFLGAAVTWYGMGYKPHAGARADPKWDVEHDVLFGTGAAMFIRAELFEQLGGFDDRFFMFYDDVDLGWRLNLLGWRVRFQPSSLAYHKHHASMKKFGAHKETYLLERNALFTLYKNLGDEELGTALPAAMALAVRRAVARGKLDTRASRSLRADRDGSELMKLPKSTLAGVFAIDQFVEQLPSLAESRAVVQGGRVRTDLELRELFGNRDEPAYRIESYIRGYARIVNAFGLPAGRDKPYPEPLQRAGGIARFTPRRVTIGLTRRIARLLKMPS